MAEFGKPFFRSTNTDIEQNYTHGVICVQNGDYYGADRYFRYAAAAGHISALYNLSMLHGSGLVSPYEIDLAITCLRKAAAGGHPRAEQFLPWVDKAEDTTLGTIALAMLASNAKADGRLNHIVMMSGCALYSALCKKHEVEEEFIAHELDGASYSDEEFVLRFVKRTGLSNAFYSNGLDNLVSGSAADQITDGLIHLHTGLMAAGHTERMIVMAKCTIVGYVISKSKHGAFSAPLLGMDKFFAQ